jgi:hypothetical protein
MALVAMAALDLYFLVPQGDIPHRDANVDLKASDQLKKVTEVQFGRYPFRISVSEPALSRRVLIVPASGDTPSCRLDLVKNRGCDASLYDRICRPPSAGLIASTIL